MLKFPLPRIQTNTDNLYQIGNHSGTCSDIDHIWHVFIASPTSTSWNDGSNYDTVAHIHSWEYGCAVNSTFIAGPFTPSSNSIDVSFKYTYDDSNSDPDDFLKSSFF